LIDFVVQATAALVGFADAVILTHDGPQVGVAVIGELDPAAQDGPFNGVLAELFFGTEVIRVRR
jgi:hypothetical protein